MIGMFGTDTDFGLYLVKMYLEFMIPEWIDDLFQEMVAVVRKTSLNDLFVSQINSRVHLETWFTEGFILPAILNIM